MSLLLVLMALLLAFANGANDNFKGVATLYGSRTLSYRAALIWATASTLAGSLCAVLLAGGLVKRFGGKGLVSDAVVADPAFLLAAAMAAAATVLLATRLGFPVSTTHALLGGLVGAGMALAGPGQVAYGALGASFVLPLLLSPLLALLFAATLYRFFRWARHACGVTEETCVCVGGVEQIATFVPGNGALLLANGLKVSVDSVERCERRYRGTVAGISAQAVLDRAHVTTAGAVGFARGLNDTPKIVALLVGAQGLGVATGLPLTALLIAIGGLLGARRVAETMSFGITSMNHGQGFTANLVTATLVTLASTVGLPVSTTHVSCGALFGIGAANGEARWRTIGQILTAWLTTLPVATACGAAFALGAKALHS
jgi:inorganic phosphate transporter, PiT family